MKTQQKTKYDVQAEKFVKNADFHFVKEYTGHRLYFDGDKERRATFKITVFSNTDKAKSFSYDFGNSVAESFKARNREGVHFMQNAKSFASYETSELHKRDIVEVKTPPSDYSLLSCMASDSYQSDTFEDWCDDFGYDTDSRKALDTFLKCQIISADINRFFTETELEQLCEIN